MIIISLPIDDWISVLDLLYGIMLPSGNDAAMVLAENFGALLYYESMGQYRLVESKYKIN